MDTAAVPCLHLLCCLVCALAQLSVFQVGRCAIFCSFFARASKVTSVLSGSLVKEAPRLFSWSCAWTSLGAFFSCQLLLPLHPDVYLRRQAPHSMLFFLCLGAVALLVSCTRRRSILLRRMALFTFPMLWTLLLSLLAILVLFPVYVFVGLTFWVAVATAYQSRHRNLARRGTASSILSRLDKRRIHKAVSCLFPGQGVSRGGPGGSRGQGEARGHPKTPKNLKKTH